MQSTSNTIDDQMMRRAIQLAARATREVSANPRVGCVISANGNIIGEGYHQKIGDDHAERAALKNVSPLDKRLLAEAHMYVTLEPCNHHGRTPPCTDAIIAAGIRKITIATLDPNPLMQGKSVALLRSLGIEVNIGLLAEDASIVNGVFITNQLLKRPHICLKWAQSKNGLLGSSTQRIIISNRLSQIYTHKLRSQHDGIMIGTNTAIIDNPKLTNRFYPGATPKRIVIDKNGRIPYKSSLLLDADDCIIYSIKDKPANLAANKTWIQLLDADFTLTYILNDLYINGIHNIMIEGGAQLLDAFITNNLWDEAHIIKSPKKVDGDIKAPMIKGLLVNTYSILNDQVDHLINPMAKGLR